MTANGPNGVVEDSPPQDVLGVLASRHRMLPACSIASPDPATVDPLTSRLASGPESRYPWLPMGSLGPLLIMGHFNPACADFMGVPSAFRVEVIVGPRTYDEHYLEHFSRWSPKKDYAGFTKASPTGTKPPTPQSLQLGVRETLDWFLHHYPLKEAEHQSLITNLTPLLDQAAISRCEIDQVVPQLGVAIERIRTGGHVFNPRYAPSLPPPFRTPAALAILQEFRVYPLFDRPRSRYWLCPDAPTAHAAEEAWHEQFPPSDHAPIDVFPVLADVRALEKKLQAELEHSSHSDFG